MARFLSERKKKNLSIDIHPSAHGAYHFFHSQEFLFDKTKLGFDALQALQTGQKFSVCLSSETECCLFSGFEIPGFAIEQFDIRGRELLIYDDLSDNEIELRAWTGVLRVLLSSLQSSQLELFRKDLNDTAPEHIIQTFFSGKSLTQKKLVSCTPLSLSGLKKQAKSPTQDPKVASASRAKHFIFEHLVNEARNKS